jgi:hypothetical protein
MMRVIIAFMNEGTPRSVESGEFKERLSADYQNIRDTALTMLDHKIDLAKAVLGPNNSELARIEAAKALLDDQYVINKARDNNWEQFRGLTEDGDETDKKLAEGLVESVLNLQ